MSLAPCILASLEEDVDDELDMSRNRKRSFVFIIEGELLLFAFVRSVCRRGDNIFPHHLLQGKVRGLCPPAFNDPWLISGAP